MCTATTRWFHRCRGGVRIPFRSRQCICRHLYYQQQFPIHCKFPGSFKILESTWTLKLFQTNSFHCEIVPSVWAATPTPSSVHTQCGTSFVAKRTNCSVQMPVWSLRCSTMSPKETTNSLVAPSWQFHICWNLATTTRRSVCHLVVDWLPVRSTP